MAVAQVFNTGANNINNSMKLKLKTVLCTNIKYLYDKQKDNK